MDMSYWKRKVPEIELKKLKETRDIMMQGDSKKHFTIYELYTVRRNKFNFWT